MSYHEDKEALSEPLLPPSEDIEAAKQASDSEKPKEPSQAWKKVLRGVLLSLVIWHVSFWIGETLNARYGGEGDVKGVEDVSKVWPLSALPDLEEHRPPHHGHGRHRPPRFLNGKPAEKIFLGVPNNESAIVTSKHFAGKPHMAGTDNDYSTAVDFLHLLQKELGISSSLEDPVFKAGTPESRNATLGIPKLTNPTAWVDTYFPVLNTPVNHSVEILDDDGKSVIWKAQLEEVADSDLDPDAKEYAEAIPAFHGLSRGGEVQGKLVYAHYGRKEDYDALEEKGVDLNGSIVITRYGGIFRGLKVKGAQERGAVGCLVYSDLRDDGTVRYENGYAAYPQGPARNPTSVQRGSVQFLSMYPGDPTTPGEPAYENSNRTEGENIPSIPSLPISWNTASRLLQEIEVEGKNRTIKLVNNVDTKVTPIWNTMAVIPGHIKNEVVMVGNHRDAWVLGATDPTSGTVSTYEVVRGLGTLLKKGWKPLRTILIASWDAEEYGLIGSTEWGEDFPEWISEHVVAYLNLDSSVGGSRFGLSASPSLAHLVRGAAEDIPHPTDSNRTLWEARLDRGPLYGNKLDEDAVQAWEQQWGEPYFNENDHASSNDFKSRIKGGSKLAPRGQTIQSLSTGVKPVGSGSDYTVFLQRIGIAITNGGFGATLSDPVYHYHSVFDSHTWQEKYGDPGFHRHVAVAKHLGLQLLRLTDSIILPINTTQYATELHEYLDKVEAIAEDSSLDADFSDLRSSISSLNKASTKLDVEKRHAEVHLRKLVQELLKHRHGHRHSIVRRIRCFFRKVAKKLGLSKCSENVAQPEESSDLGASGKLQIREGLAVAKIREHKHNEGSNDHHDTHPHHHKDKKRHGKKPSKSLLKKLKKAIKRVQVANQKLVGFERGFISEDGLKDREWYRHLGVAPGKWLGYGATTLPGITEALTIDKNATLAQEEAKRVQTLIDDLVESLKA